VIGGVAYLALSPYLSSAYGSATTLLSSIPEHISNLTQQINPVIQYVKDNALQVGSVTTAVGGAVAWISTKIYRANVQKKEIETTAQMNGVQSSLFQAQGEVLGLQNQLTEAKSTISTLESNASNVTELTSQLKAKQAEVERLQAEKNALERMFPQVKTVERMIEESKKVP